MNAKCDSCRKNDIRDAMFGLGTFVADRMYNGLAVDWHDANDIIQEAFRVIDGDAIEYFTKGLEYSHVCKDANHG